MEYSFRSRARVGFFAIATIAATGWAQSTLPAVFVANNGNLRGSVTSLTIAPTGALTVVQDYVTGEVPSGQTSPGTNAYSIALSPNGRYLAASHATSAGTTEQVSLLRVNPDATLTPLSPGSTPDSPLDLEWLSDSLLVVTRTRSSGLNELVLYRFAETPPHLTEIQRVPAGAFASRLALNPARTLLFCNDSPLSGGGGIRAFLVDAAAGTLTEAGSTPTGTTYVLGQDVSPDGRFLFVAGGASTPYRMGGMAIGADGVLTWLEASPFPSSGTSPKECVFSPGSEFLYVGHGSDSTIRVHAVSPDGALSNEQLVYDVGIQGSLGDIASVRLASGLDLLVFTDKETYDSTPRGIFSGIIQPSGLVQLVTTRLDTGAISPNDLAVWPGAPAACDADLNQDGNSDQDDVAYLVGVLAGATNPTGVDPDFNRDGNPDQDDLDALINVIAGGACP